MAQQNSSEEVDLGYLFRSLGNLLKKIAKLIFLIIAFFRKYIIVTILLIIVGFVFGYYSDRDPIYENELIVIPNFESTDYLYEEIEALNQKKEAKDTLFFKTIFGDDFQDFVKIDIEPIVDIYSFMAEKKDYIETLKILYNDKDGQEFLIDKSISKYYKYHKIKITCKGNNSESISTSLLKYLNDNPHFKLYQQVGLSDTEIQISQNEKMISQIDSILKSVSDNSDGKQSQSVYINTQSDLYQMINTKQALLNNRLKLHIKFIDQHAVIKLVSANYNLKVQGFKSIPNKIKFPIYFILLFSGIFLLIYLYKRLKQISR